MEQSEATVVMQGSIADLERMAAMLGEHGVDAAIMRPDEPSGSS